MVLLIKIKDERLNWREIERNGKTRELKSHKNKNREKEREIDRDEILEMQGK